MSEPESGTAGVTFAEKAQFELLCLANHVEAINGLLYMTGGGWTEHHRPPLQPNGSTTISHIGIAVMVRIPWNETNRPHRFQVEIQDLAGDGDHYAATVISTAFAGKSKIQQHQMVYGALGGRMGGVLHALKLTTMAQRP